MPRRDDIPPGWSYNPATWGQRLPIVGLAVLGGAIAGYLALWQYDIVDTVWEPFFGDGSRRILDSELSYLLPIPDAALGALAYLADAAAGAIGSRRRWRTMPWIVVIFAILVGPLGAVSIGLVIAQPVLYDAWCTLCLATALISTVMIGPAMDEALATLQHLRRVHDDPNRSLWRAFWGLRPAPDRPRTRGD
ncbi:MAG: vitamin K epoxide reductase family protein [Phycisphaerales bacterium JB039]